MMNEATSIRNDLYILTIEIFSPSKIIALTPTKYYIIIKIANDP